MRSRSLKLAVVSGAIRSEVELNCATLAEYFTVIVAGDDITTSKPEPDGYLLAVERLNQQYPNLDLQPWECLAIEDTRWDSSREASRDASGWGCQYYPLHAPATSQLDGGLSL